MKRLRDELRSGDPRLRAAARLVQSVPPVGVRPQRRRLIRLRIDRGRRSRASRLRPVVIAVPLLLLGVAGARGMIDGGGWQSTRARVNAWLHGDSAAATARTAQAPHPPKAVMAPAPVAAPPAPPPPPPRPEIVRPTAQPAVVTHPRAPKASPAPATSAAPAPPNPEADLMLQAIAARRGGDQAGAARLLARYRQQYPQGLFEEEALVLSIEAAAAARPTEAAALSRLYLQRFPSGRFHDRVAGGLRAAAPP